MAVFWHFFCFYGMCITAGSRNRFVDHHTQSGMETLRGPFLFLCAATSQSGMPASIAGKNFSSFVSYQRAALL